MGECYLSTERKFDYLNDSVQLRVERLGLKINKLLTLMGVYQCLIVIFPLGFYKIEPPPSSVGILWGFLVAPAYIFFAGILLIFRFKISSYIKTNEYTIIILSGLVSSIIAFLAGAILYPLTQKLIEETYQIYTHTEMITYLDVETGGIFYYLIYGIGVFCLVVGILMYFDRLKSVNGGENLVNIEN